MNDRTYGYGISDTEIYRVSGALAVIEQVSGVISPIGSVSGNVSVPIEEVLEIYNGQSRISPSVHEDVTLRTANKKLIDNLVVEKVFYAEVSNDSGGMTATIGDVNNGY